MTLDNSIKKDLHRHKIDVEQIVFATLLSDADATKLTEWIKTLSSKDYIEFFKLCDNHKEESEVLNNKIFRTSKGNLYSYNELKSTNIQPDVLINNAGILPPFARFSTGGGAETVRRTTELNFLSQASAIEIMLPLLIDSKRGAIINVSSSSSLCALPGSAAYSASKAASRAFTEALACEYSGRLYIASVCPGFTKTPIFDGQKPGIDRFLVFSTSPEKMARRILGGIRRGRRLIVRGVDAHAMNLLYRCFGTYGERLCASVLRRFGGEVFSDCFEKKADAGKPDNLS